MKKKAGKSTPEAESSKGWTFLTNHAHVLIVLYSEADLSLREVAMRVGITERAVQRIVQDLEEGRFHASRKGWTQEPLLGLHGSATQTSDRGTSQDR